MEESLGVAQIIMSKLIIGAGIGLATWIAILSIPHTVNSEPTKIEYKTEPSLIVATTTPKVWTKDAVIQRIRQEFPMAPIMVKVASCESGFDPSAYNPTNGSHDGGVFQISKKYHGEEMKKLNLDPFDVEDNIKYAKVLYVSQGLEPWRASRFCWKKS